MSGASLAGIGALVRQRASGRHSSGTWSLVSAANRPGALPLDVVQPLEGGAGFGFAVTDGALGEDGGREASLAVAAAVGHLPPPDADACCDLLAEADLGLASAGVEGEASAALAVLAGDRLHGASAGDCEAWLFPPGASPACLTARQNRRPRLGGSAAASPFSAAFPRRSVAIVASDGLWVNASVPEVAAIAGRVPAERLADALLAYVWTRKGGRLPDDIAVGVVGS